VKKIEGPQRRIGILAAVALLAVAAFPASTAVASPPDLRIEPPPMEPSEGGGQLRFARMLEHLSDLLQRLEGELAALDRPAAERLENGLEEAIEAIEAFLDGSERPSERPDERARKARITQLDLRLHRLVRVLEEIVEKAPEGPGRPRALVSIEELREWIDDCLALASAGMSVGEYERFERTAHQVAKFLGERISEVAKNAPARPESSRLARLVERLEDLLFRLDGVLLRQFPGRE
jgi:hypothetical protein